jgi:NMD protein affecting ribosome stability and mRNA decay
MEGKPMSEPILCWECGHPVEIPNRWGLCWSCGERDGEQGE